MSSAHNDRATLVAELSLSMRRVIVETVLLFDTLASRLGINATDMQCLNILDFEGSVSAGRLAELTGLSTGSMTTAIDRLEKAGYVRRVRDPHDRRRVLVQPIRDDKENVFQTIDQAWQDFCRRFCDDELAVILNFTQALYQLNHGTVARVRSGEAFAEPS